MSDEESTIEFKVQQRLKFLLAEQQTAFATAMEQSVKHAVNEIEKTRADLEAECKRLQQELEAVRALHAKADREGEKLAYEAFTRHQHEYTETIRTTLLRDLVRLHLEGGKTAAEIIKWIGVDRHFVECIREVVNRVKQFRNEEPSTRNQLEVLDFVLSMKDVADLSFLKAPKAVLVHGGKWDMAHRRLLPSHLSNNGKSQPAWIASNDWMFWISSVVSLFVNGLQRDTSSWANE